MSKEIAIQVDHVSKDFLLPHEKTGSVKGLFTGFFKKRSKKSKETQHALSDINFTINKGEFFGIVGRNGSGKSTLLKIIAGIYQPTKGSVSVNGKLVPFIELGVGFNPELSGRDNVYLNGAMLGFSVKEVDAMYDDIVSFAEIERFMDQKLKNYSSGMQVRLAFSLAIRSEADILVIDEVLAVGDEDFQRKCYNYFKTLKKDKKTVVFVSHDMGAVREFCSRAMLINDSKIEDIGKTSDIAGKYSQLFINNVFYERDKKDNSSSRWGSGLIKVDTIDVEKPIYSKDDKKIKISISLEAFETQKHPMVGIRIKNATGQIVNESNTWIEKKKFPILKKGEYGNVTWELPNIYADGIYSIDVYTQAFDGVVFDNWDEAVLFQVKRVDAQGSLIKLKSLIKIKTFEK